MRVYDLADLVIVDSVFSDDIYACTVNQVNAVYFVSWEFLQKS